MDKNSNRKTAIILYFGVGVQTTPKIQLIKGTLEKRYKNVLISGITAKPFEPESKHKIIPVTTNNKLMKVLISVTAIIKLCFWINSKSPDLIYAINPIPGLIASTFKKIKKTKFIYETLEIFSGIDYFPYSRRYRKLWYLVEKTAIQNSEKSFTTDEFRLKLLRRYLKVTSQKLSYTYNTNKAPTSLEINSKPSHVVLSYCGGVYPGRQIDEIILAFSLFKRIERSAKLIIAGSGDPLYLESLKKLSYNLKLAESVRFTGYLSNEELKNIMRNSTITFAFYKNDSLNNRLNSPNKIFDSIFSKTALITTSSPLARKVILANGAGKIINSTSPQEVYNKCKELISIEHSQPNYEELIKKYCWESEENKILEALPEI
ncbi:glycosyltransferase [Pseudomonas pseudonitroreducens]|uniref:glycosyltransferase n=1 Tax=Pseudomonas pseudonitroreducens TaxID=2892326 RepID=UPI001F36F858|nr:glycosyltransferase [Pseudomonas pseudonitroreducens]